MGRKSTQIILPIVLAGGFHSLVHDLHDIVWNHVLLATDPDSGIISLEKLPMIHKLLKLGLGHVHKALYLSFWSIKVLQAEGIDCDNLDSTLVADFQDL